MAISDNHTEDLARRLVATDPYLAPYARAIADRCRHIHAMAHRITEGRIPLPDFASGHEYYGLHMNEGGWVFREWAPNATDVFLVSDATGWVENDRWALQRINDNGDWELRLPPSALRHGDLYRLRIGWPGGVGDRIPAYARRVLQDPDTLIFNAQVWHPPAAYRWRHPEWTPTGEPPLVYEVHPGMAQEAHRVGTFREFTEHIIPRIVTAGYNTIQLMAVQEHPYYGSFGYQVSSFFAVSSRFGTPEDLKALVDTAHGSGLAVIMDLVHSHAVSNEVEGLGRFDGTPYQYFHAGQRGVHPAWGSRCFDYGKPQVLHFLLSNCRYWKDEFHIDGYRFDGVTSMLYHHHGLGTAFTHYDDYFDGSVDVDALAYLAMANELIHGLDPGMTTVAEDVSGLPGLAVAAADGGYGFDYRYAMGIPDFWIKLTKDVPDEHWPMGQLWHELTNRRDTEKTISYAESHDQALVGDQTLIFRLIGSDIYTHMHRDDPHMGVDRGMALHKMIRLITLATAGDGYLNFMGNEFGHPEWIDFPREGNRWSYDYARRQWHLMDDPDLKYRQLAAFDRDMLALAAAFDLLHHRWPLLRHEHNDDKTLAFERGRLLFVFNFHPRRSHADYAVGAVGSRYRLVLDSDQPVYGGHDRLQPDVVFEGAELPNNSGGLKTIRVYAPARTALVLENISEKSGIETEIKTNIQ